MLFRFFFFFHDFSYYFLFDEFLLVNILHELGFWYNCRIWWWCSVQKLLEGSHHLFNWSSRLVSLFPDASLIGFVPVLGLYLIVSLSGRRDLPSFVVSFRFVCKLVEKLAFISPDISSYFLMDLIVLTLCFSFGCPCSAVENLVLLLFLCFDLLYGFYRDPFYVLVLLRTEDLVGCFNPCLFPLLPHFLCTWLLVVIIKICQCLVPVDERNLEGSERG